MSGDWRRSALRRLSAAAVRVTLLTALAVSLVACGSVPSPSRELMTTTNSPDGRWVVRVFYANPGAAGSASVVVEATPSAGGTATSIATIRPDELARATWASDDKLTVKWLSNSELSVGGYPAGVPVR